jgi:hypothetical protein
VRRGVVAESDLRVVGRHVERDVGSVLRSARAVILIPAFVEGDLALVVSGGQRCGLKRVRAVAVRVLQPRAEAGRLPIAGAAEFRLETARRDGDDGIAVAGNPVRLVVVIKFDALTRAERERDVGAVLLRVETVILTPVVIERSFVLPVAGGDGERALPYVVIRVASRRGNRVRSEDFRRR